MGVGWQCGEWKGRRRLNSSSSSIHPDPPPHLHVRTQAGEYGQAAQRLAQAASLPSTTDLRPAADAYASLLAEWAEGGYRGEADLFVARAVLHILARVSSPAGMDAAGAYARAVLEAAAAKADGGMGMAGVEGSPLVHFVWVLVELVQVRCD